jgi:hypothetical protein
MRLGLRENWAQLSLLVLVNNLGALGYVGRRGKKPD